MSLLGRAPGFVLVLLALSGCSTPEPRAEAEPVDASAGPVARPRLHVQLAPRADRPWTVRDLRPGVGARVRLVGASPVAPHLELGLVRFARAHEGRFDVLQSAKPDGVEDFVRFDARPSRAEVAYELDLDDAVAGLRLVANVLELLGPDGAPRVRMEPPWIESDGDHVRRPVGVAVEGCAVDRDPSAPWTRAPRDPGARRCLVRLTWGEIEYPATLDPSWSSTALTMTVPRTSHTATTLANGDVLVVGGCQSFGGVVNASAEIYGATVGAFAATAAMAKTRAYHTATALLDGSVLVTGGIQSGGSGCRNGTGNADAELWKDGTWTTVPMTTSRAWHAATRLLDGRVLVAGGHDGNESVVRANAELFDPATKSFKATPSMMAPRYAFGVGLLRDGRALAVAGAGGGGNTVDAFDPVTEAWSAAPALAVSVSSHRVATLVSGKVMTVGGFGSTYVGEFDPVTNAWSARPALAASRWEIELVPLPTGGLLAIGGHGGSGGSTAVDLFPDGSGRLAHPSTPIGRTWAAAAGVGAPMDRVLVTGGNASDASPSQSADLSLVGVAAGGTCASDSDCALSLRCVATKCEPYAPEAGIVWPDTGAIDTGVVVDDASVDSELEDAATSDAATSDTATSDTAAPDSAPADTGSAADGATTNDASTVAPADPTEKPVLAGEATPCSDASQCASGFCVDGVCCDSACDDPCHSCALPMAPGKCMLQPTGYDMRGECDSERPCYSTCGPAGACIPSFAGARCAEQRCTGPATGRGPAVCSGERGSCLRDDAIDFDCTPYSCEAAFGACNSQCSRSDQCAPGYLCDTASSNCVAAPVQDEGGCAIGAPGRSGSLAWLGVVSGLMLAGRRRRRHAGR